MGFMDSKGIQIDEFKVFYEQSKTFETVYTMKMRKASDNQIRSQTAHHHISNDYAKNFDSEVFLQ